MSKKVRHVFMSHTKLDKGFCDRFDSAAARVGIGAFRSDFETIETIDPPAWKMIRGQITKSCAIFLLVGKELVKAQITSDILRTALDPWKHTQNWIAYEVGLACQKGIDVWVVCDNVEINFPVPYFNNYSLGLGNEIREIGFIRWVLEEYSKGKSFTLRNYEKRNTRCPHEDCRIEFNLHSKLDANYKMVCPTCLRTMVFKEGFFPKEK